MHRPATPGLSSFPVSTASVYIAFDRIRPSCHNSLPNHNNSTAVSLFHSGLTYACTKMSPFFVLWCSVGVVLGWFCLLLPSMQELCKRLIKKQRKLTCALPARTAAPPVQKSPGLDCLKLHRKLTSWGLKPLKTANDLPLSICSARSTFSHCVSLQHICRTHCSKFT